MSLLLIAVLAAAIVFTICFSMLTYSLRDFSRPKFTDYLETRGKARLAAQTIEHVEDLIFATASLRLVANIAILLCLLKLFESPGQAWWVHYLLAALVTLLITCLFSVAIPHAVARQLIGEIGGHAAVFGKRGHNFVAVLTAAHEKLARGNLHQPHADRVHDGACRLAA